LPDSTGQGASVRPLPPTRRAVEFDDGGYILAVLLISLAVGAVWMSALLPAWRQQAIREKEAELVFRGEQYARAIALYNRANPGTLPPSIELLVSQHYLRKAYKDPITGEDFLYLGSGIPGQLGSTTATSVIGTGIEPGTLGQNAPTGTAGPVQAPGGGAVGLGSAMRGIYGVRSRSAETSIRIYNGFQQYNLWAFDFTQALQRLPALPAPPGQGIPRTTNGQDVELGLAPAGRGGRGRGAATDGRGGRGAGRGGDAPAGGARGTGGARGGGTGGAGGFGGGAGGGFGGGGRGGN